MSTQVKPVFNTENLIPVSKNGKYFGLADAKQLRENKNLKRWPPNEQPVAEEKIPTDEDQKEPMQPGEGANAAEVKKAPGKPGPKPKV